MPWLGIAYIRKWLIFILILIFVIFMREWKARLPNLFYSKAQRSQSMQIFRSLNLILEPGKINYCIILIDCERTECFACLHLKHLLVLAPSVNWHIGSQTFFEEKETGKKKCFCCAGEPWRTGVAGRNAHVGHNWSLSAQPGRLVEPKFSSLGKTWPMCSRQLTKGDGVMT